MYWLNAPKLAEDLRDGRVDERERFKYFLATLIGWTTLIQIYVYAGGPFSIDRLVSAVANLTAAVIGLILCYRVNRSGDNQDFIGRMVCLGWPVGVFFVGTFLGVITLMLAADLPEMAMSDSGAVLSNGADKLRKVSVLLGSTPILGWGILCYFNFIRFSLRTAAKTEKRSGVLGTMMTTKLSGAESVFALIGVIGGFIIFMFGMVLMPSLVAVRSLADLLTYLAVGLWVLFFGYIIAILQRRSTKHT